MSLTRFASLLALALRPISSLSGLRLVFMGLPLMLLIGCAGSLNSGGNNSANQALVVATTKDVFYLPPPTLPDSAMAALAPMGWDTTRFQQELLKEITFQFRRQNIGIVADSAAAPNRVTVVLTQWQREGGLHFGGYALLQKDTNQRRIDLPLGKTQGAQGVERSDPTVDRIRDLATAIVTGARKDPKEKPKRHQKPEYTPQLMLIF